MRASPHTPSLIHNNLKYAVESQIRHHNLDPSSALILVSPSSPTSSTISTASILSAIDRHAESLALILLPAIQYYTGQYFDVATITAHAHKHNIPVGWDLAHAVGNVELRLHDWDVDFAAWCNYKYLNSGPGAIAGAFVHGRHGAVVDPRDPAYRPRLSGWWGADKATRFAMDNVFVPRAGAAGWQLSNPSALDLTAVLASLEIFEQTSMARLRSKSVRLTGYLEVLLLHAHRSTTTDDGATQLDADGQLPYDIITPANPAERGAQLSIRLRPGLLDGVMEELESRGVVVDERRPDVVRVAPAPLYNTFVEVWEFVRIWTEACERVNGGKKNAEEKEGEVMQSSVSLEGGREDKGWESVK